MIRYVGWSLWCVSVWWLACTDDRTDAKEAGGAGDDAVSLPDASPADSSLDSGGSGGDSATGTEGGEADCSVAYDASDNPYRLDNGGGWQGMSEDGCPTDKFTTWVEWQCAPGVLKGAIARFWARDTIPTDDPEYAFAGHETIVNAEDGELEMGVFMLSVDPVVLSKVDFEIHFPADLLAFSRIERHWAAIKRDEPPSAHTNVEVVAPGVLRFTWDMECLPRVIHKGDIPVASMYFDILASGEGMFEFPRPEGETWDNYTPPYKWHLKSEVTEPRPVWATVVDGTQGAVPWLWNVKVVIR